MGIKRLSHTTLERISILIVLIAIAVFGIYYLVYQINWIGIYSEKDSGSFKNLSVLKESCIQCHGEVKGFSPYHNPQKIGCSSCHLGDTSVKTKLEAHYGMIRIPGNLNSANQSCGQVNCHPGISERVDSSLMSTMSGVISVNKYAFDEIESPIGKFYIQKIGRSASESHLRSLCASCHLGNEKTEFGSITELSRGGGCNACHLNYSDEALSDLNNYDSLKIATPDSAFLNFHPSLSLKITNDHCFGCHSRSGRISTSYEGWHETSLSADDVGEDKNYRLLQDGRIFKMIKPDVHYELGLVCIDCHISYEVMGDGNTYEHKEEQIIVKCEDCHSRNQHETLKLSEFDYESRKIAELDKIDDDERKFIIVEKSGTPLVNTYLDLSRKAKLVGKVSGKTHDLNPPQFNCVASEAHNNLSCNSCHTSWAPQCIGCHTEYNPNIGGYDLLDNKHTDSTWVEYHGEFFAELPTLGIREEDENGHTKRIVDTFIPGMIMTLDKSKYKGNNYSLISKRLFAQTVAHTIQETSRSCKSCHNNSLAIGYGRGDLEYVINKNIGRWIFSPEFDKVKFDNLPEDAWIGFLARPGRVEKETAKNATRENIRPFNIDEQKIILTVGACLTCHKSESEIMISSLRDYENQIMNLSEKCIIPTWK